MIIMNKSKPAIYIIFVILTTVILGCTPQYNWILKPLTFDSFQSFLSGQTSFTALTLRYDDITGGREKTFWAGAGELLRRDESLNISEYLEFYGSSTNDYETRKYQLEDLTPVFDYLTEHKGYFFNNEEMINKRIINADLSSIWHLEKKRYMFSLIIHYPNGNKHESWIISKSVDVLNDEMKGLYDICFATVINSPMPPQAENIEKSPVK